MAVSIKICGFTETADVEAALAMGVDAFGLVLDSSPQQVDAGRIPELLRAGSGALSVAVTGRTDPDGVRRAFEMGFDLVQAVMALEDWWRLEPELPALPVLFDGPDLVERAETLFALGRPPTALGALSVDGAGGGGTGRQADWTRAAACGRKGPLMLSGGLRSDNIGEALAVVTPAAVDVSSFTESSPGRKDRARMRAFIEAVRAASPGPGG